MTCRRRGHPIPRTQTADPRVIAGIGITVDPDARLAVLRIIWQGGAATELTMPTTKKGGCVAVAGEETIQQIH